MKRNEWLCIQCGYPLGELLGGDLSVTGLNLRTRGVNLVITCPQCASDKVWYPADPVVRAIYQLVDAISTQAAKRMVEIASQQLMEDMRRQVKA